MGDRMIQVEALAKNLRKRLVAAEARIKTLEKTVEKLDQAHRSGLRRIDATSEKHEDTVGDQSSSKA